MDEKTKIERRLEKWNSTPLEEKLYMFSPRIIKELKTAEFSEKDKRVLQTFKSRFIYGKPGTGKTLFAAQNALELMKKNTIENKEWKEVLFVSFIDLLQQIRNTYNKNSEISEQDVIDEYRKVDFLIIDDFGIEKDNDWTFQIIYSIINYRYEHLLPIIITSNYTLEEIEENLSDSRITSRIDEMCDIIELTEIKRQSNP